MTLINMIICATKGQAIAELIQWFGELSPIEWLYFIAIMFMSFAFTRISYVFVKNHTKRNISDSFQDVEIIFSPRSWFVIPSCVFLIINCLLLILFDLVEDDLLLILTYGFIFVAVLGCSAFTRYSQCCIIKCNNIYYLSKYWFGKKFEKIEPNQITLKETGTGIRVYHNNRLYGVIVDPGSRPWLKNQKRKFDEFLEFVN